MAKPPHAAPLLILAALAAVLPAGARPSAPAHRHHDPINATIDAFTLHSAANGLCLSYYPGSDASTVTTVDECRTFQATQAWYLAGPGAKVKSAVNSYCLTVCQGDGCHAYRNDKMTQVIMLKCEDASNAEQNWVLNDGRFLSGASGDCLTQCTTCTDDVIVTYPCSGLASQQWHQLPAAEEAMTSAV